MSPSCILSRLPDRATAGVLALLFLLTGCAADPFRADVTRFHAEQLPTLEGASVTIRPFEDDDTPQAQFAEQAAMLGEALAMTGFRPAGDEDADIVARLKYSTSPLQMARDSGVRIGIGGGHFGDNVGVSGGLSFPVGESGPQTGYNRRLDLALYDAPSGRRIWEGRAMSTGRSDDHMQILTLLARALLRDFPGEAGHTVEVEIPVDKDGRPLSDTPPTEGG